jgi:hypothetical protein
MGCAHVQNPSMYHRQTKAQSHDWAFVALTSGLRQGAVDGAEGIADLGSQQSHDSDHDDGDEREDDRVLDEPLAFFFRSKQHKNLPFEKKMMDF